MPRSAQTFRAHNNEILSLDWNKYRENSIVTASVDHTIKVWDLRFPERELMCLRGHEYAVRRVKCSPHDGNLVASASYDMTMRLWDISGKENAMIYVHDQHSEFVLGLDFNLYVEGQIATASWDQEIHMFTPPPLMRRR
jgi:peroxin-7